MADEQNEIIPGQEVKTTPELEKALDAAVSPEEIREIIAQEAAKQNITIPRDPKGRFTEKKDEPKVADETEKEAVVFADDFVIGGKSYHFEGDSPGDINRQVKAAIAAYENAISPQKKDEPVAKKGLTSDEKVSLQLDMQLGRITPEEYLEKTGYIDSYLENKGIKVDELKEVVAEKKTKKEENAWQSATDAFLKIDGNDWPGGGGEGNPNLKVLGYKLAELGLSDKPSVESLQKAYDAMKADNLVFKSETKVTETKTEEHQPTKKKLSGSSMFGVGGGNATKDHSETTKSQAPEIRADMSPREIMEAFKQAALASGQNPDDIIRQSQRR